MEPWGKGEWLRLPVHEVHAFRDDYDPSALEILLNESSGNEWIFRRNLKVRQPLSAIGLSSENEIPFLNPEIVLLYKAKSPAAYDEADFINVCKILNQDRIRWLKKAIETCHPGHPWLALQ